MGCDGTVHFSFRQFRLRLYRKKKSTRRSLPRPLPHSTLSSSRGVTPLAGFPYGGGTREEIAGQTTHSAKTGAPPADGTGASKGAALKSRRESRRGSSSRLPRQPQQSLPPLPPLSHAESSATPGPQPSQTTRGAARPILEGPPGYSVGMERPPKLFPRVPACLPASQTYITAWTHR